MSRRTGSLAKVEIVSLEYEWSIDAIRTVLGIALRKVGAMDRRSRSAVLWIASSTLAIPVLGQSVYPVQGQSPEQQKQDESRCSAWAMQQSGFDTAKPWLAPQVSPYSISGSSTRVRGATAAAVAGGGTHPDAGDAVVAGAIIAASTQPATGGTTDGSRRREVLAAGAGADREMRAQPLDAKMRQDSSIAGSTASTSLAASAAAAAILGRDAGNVTAAGAVAAPTPRRDINRMIILQEEPPVSQQQPSQQASFQKARTECLEARGYTP
jgi:hypothetical protein